MHSAVGFGLETVVVVVMVAAAKVNLEQGPEHS